jgi:hypothetical protein
MNNKTYLFLALSLLLTCATSSYAVELLVQNDLNPLEDGDTLEIEEAVSIEAPRNKVTFKVKNEEKKSITGGNVRSFMLVRVFSRHKLKYDILCPKDAKGGGVVTVAKAHMNDLPGGCKVVRIGHWSKRGGMNWDVTDKDSWDKLRAERRGNNELRRE